MVKDEVAGMLHEIIRFMKSRKNTMQYSEKSMSYGDFVESIGALEAILEKFDSEYES